MRPWHKGVQKLQRGAEPLVHFQKMMLYQCRALKRGENIYEIRSSYFAPQLPGSCRCHLCRAGSDSLRRLFQLHGCIFCSQRRFLCCGWHRTGRHPEHHAGDRGPVSDPQVATDGTSFEVIADYTDGLMQMDADGAAVPAMAETYDISEDGKTYTFHLRDAKWSNGEAVTAADFVFGWQRAVDPATASEYSYMLSDIGQVVNAAEIIAGEKPVTDLGVTAVDDKTLEVQLNVPVSYFLSLMYFPTFYPVNEAFYNTCADTFGTSPETVLSNGAFVLTDYQPAATAFAMEKNPDYYDADKIALDGLAYQVIKDSQQALMSYQTGTLDITLLNGEQVDQVKDDPEFTSVGAGYLWYISPNIDAVPDLANLNLRKAMTFALDRDAITGDVLKDGSTPAYTAVPAQFATGPDGSDFSADQTKFADDCAYDPEKAKEFFETAKAELGKDTFTFDMVVDADDAPQKVAQVVKEQLETTLEA